MDNAFIKIKDLRFSYDENTEEENVGREMVLDGIDLEIGKGEYIAVLGRNGSGKSTLAKLLNMVLSPDSGSIKVDGKEIADQDITDDEMFELRRKVGMVFQNPDNQLVATVVEDDVAFGPENLGLPRDEIRRRVDDALREVGMSELAKREPHRLSGGQKQRVAIAGIIAMMPECMIFDESTAMLDPMGRREVVETFERLRREKGITVINITHFVSEAVRADRVIIIKDGKIFLDGSPESVFSHKELIRSAGLELPQSLELVEKLEALGLDIGASPLTEDDVADAIVNAMNRL